MGFSPLPDSTKERYCSASPSKWAKVWQVLTQVARGTPTPKVVAVTRPGVALGGSCHPRAVGVEVDVSTALDVVVVGHQAVGVDYPVAAISHVPGDSEETPAVLVISKRAHPPHASGHHVVDSTIIFNAQGP